MIDMYRFIAMTDAEFAEFINGYLASAKYHWFYGTNEIWRYPYDVSDFVCHFDKTEALMLLATLPEYANLTDALVSCIEFDRRPSTVASQGCAHEWTEVILFNVASEWCNKCDTKKTSENS